MKRNIIGIFLVLKILLIFTPQDLFGLDFIFIGNVYESYNDNINFVEENGEAEKLDDFITNADIGLGIRKESRSY